MAWKFCKLICNSENENFSYWSLAEGLTDQDSISDTIEFWNESAWRLRDLSLQRLKSNPLGYNSTWSGPAMGLRLGTQKEAKSSWQKARTVHKTWKWNDIVLHSVSFSRQALTCVVYDRTFQVGSSQLLRILTVTFRKKIWQIQEKSSKASPKWLHRMAGYRGTRYLVYIDE